MTTEIWRLPPGHARCQSHPERDATHWVVYAPLIRGLFGGNKYLCQECKDNSDRASIAAAAVLAQYDERNMQCATCPAKLDLEAGYTYDLASGGYVCWPCANKRSQAPTDEAIRPATPREQGGFLA